MTTSGVDTPAPDAPHRQAVPDTELPTAVRPRGVWARFRSDRVSMAAAAVLTLVVVACFVVEPVASRLLGHGPNDPFPYAVDERLRPVGPWTRVPDVNYTQAAITDETPRTLFVLGADGTLGRDQFLRLLAGGRVSLEIAFGAATIAVLLGTLLGAVAAVRGGFLDALITRLTELVMAFPLLLLVVAIGQTVADRFDNVTLGGALEPGVLSLAAVLGLFTWFYPARVIRALTLSLRDREFVEAARMVGLSDWQIARSHLLPHLLGPMVVWATLMTATVIVFEAAISFLNLGVRLPTASWGNMLSTNWGTLFTYSATITGRAQSGIAASGWTMLWPSLAIFVTVLALTIVGEGLRAAVDPRGGEQS